MAYGSQFESIIPQDPRKRAKADEILQHQWMKEHGSASGAPLDNVILRRMQGFSAMNKLKQQALYILAKNMAPAEVAGLRAIFQVGALSAAVCSHSQRCLWCRATRGASASISCTRCGVAVLMTIGACDAQHLAQHVPAPCNARMQAMDTDKSGTVTVDELRKGLREQGSTVSEEELDNLVS